MRFKHVILFLLPIYVFASAPENELYIYNEGAKHINYDGAEISFTLGSTSLIPDKTKNYTEAYSIRPIENWKNLDTYGEVTRVGRSYYRGGYVLITVTAYRNKNKKVAQWASDQQKVAIGCENNYDSTKKCNEVYATHSGPGSETAPEELNFAFIGTIRLRYPKLNTIYVCENVIIAQGNNGIRNNWWIYTNYWPQKSDGTPKTKAYSNKLLCKTSNRFLKQEFEIDKLGNNSFMIR